MPDSDFRKGYPWLNAKKLDWNTFLKSESSKEDFSNYNTVLACDCAYRPQDVQSLVQTLKALLSRQDVETNRIHLFGPYNRAAYHQVIEWMEKDNELDVRVEWMELQRLRLQTDKDPSTIAQNWHGAAIVDAISSNGSLLVPHEKKLEEELKHSSPSKTKFLHVMAGFKDQISPGDMLSKTPTSPMADID